VKSDNRIRIALYTQLSFVAKVGRSLRRHADLDLVACRDSLSGTLDGLKSPADVLLIHLLSGSNCRSCARYGLPTAAARSSCGARSWKASLRFSDEVGCTQHLPGNISIEDFLAAVRNVHQGGLYFEKTSSRHVVAEVGSSHATTGQMSRWWRKVSRTRKSRFRWELPRTVKVYLYNYSKNSA